MSVRLRTKIGSFEVEYEGDEAFLKTNLASIVGEIASAVKTLPVGVSEQSAEPAVKNGGPPGVLDHSTNTIASLTDAKTGPDLALAAAAHLCLIKGQDKFTRKELLSEMQGATTFYNQNYSGNLSKIIGNLTKGKRLNLVGNNTFALPKAVRDEYESKLAQAD